MRQQMGSHGALSVGGDGGEDRAPIATVRRHDPPAMTKLHEIPAHQNQPQIPVPRRPKLAESMVANGTLSLRSQQ
jgi:hypothetical protein